MTSQNKSKSSGGAGNHRVVGSVSGLAARGCGAAGSGPSGEYNESPKTFRVVTLNVGTMQRKASEMVETVSPKGVDLCCLQETRWKEDGVKQIVGKDPHFKMFWSGNDNGTGGVGILLAEEWWERVFEVVRVSDRIILIRMTIGKTVFVFVSVYAPQAHLSEAEKDRFYQMLRCTVATIPASEQLIVCGDWNGHIGSQSTGCDEVHGRQAIGKRNTQKVREY